MHQELPLWCAYLTHSLYYNLMRLYLQKLLVSWSVIRLTLILSNKVLHPVSICLVWVGLIQALLQELQTPIVEGVHTRGLIHIEDIGQDWHQAVDADIMKPCSSQPVPGFAPDHFNEAGSPGKVVDDQVQLVGEQHLISQLPPEFVNAFACNFSKLTRSPSIWDANSLDDINQLLMDPITANSCLVLPSNEGQPSTLGIQGTHAQIEANVPLCGSFQHEDITEDRHPVPYVDILKRGIISIDDKKNHGPRAAHMSIRPIIDADRLDALEISNCHEEEVGSLDHHHQDGDPRPCTNR
ncbi:hypothetical protein Nepgr_015923 [Nepenthes gracilis]|uniref:Uncharacterized protein n=1 Tax=Nepenthes gracilis TaxID=150966 RepID=A0AAD3XQU1_NEPGR|nr:hypothetical protein Nepgr_015923 [Nepenthes gracilis]